MLKNHGTCGIAVLKTKKYLKGDGTGTVEKWYRGAAVVPWYRATLVHTSPFPITLTISLTPNPKITHNLIPKPFNLNLKLKSNPTLSLTLT